MFTRKRILSLSAFFVALALAAGCGPQGQDFVDVQGHYADGTPFAIHQTAQLALCDNGQKTKRCTSDIAPCMCLQGYELTAPMTQWMRGVVLLMSQNQVKAKMDYTSGFGQPVILYALQAAQSGFDYLQTNGGTVHFDSTGFSTNQAFAGTIGAMELDGDNDQPLLFIDKGSFQFYNTLSP